MKRKTHISSAIGAGSLLTIFAVLCMSVFTLLTLVSVQADLRLSDTGAKMVTAYYTADCEAEEIFAKLRQGEEVPQAQKEEDCWHYTCRISEHQTLEVTVRCDQGQWEVLRWQVAVQMPEEPSGYLPVWNERD